MTKNIYHWIKNKWWNSMMLILKIRCSYTQKISETYVNDSLFFSASSYSFMKHIFINNNSYHTVVCWGYWYWEQTISPPCLPCPSWISMIYANMLPEILPLIGGSFYVLFVHLYFKKYFFAIYNDYFTQNYP